MLAVLLAWSLTAWASGRSGEAAHTPGLTVAGPAGLLAVALVLAAGGRARVLWPTAAAACSVAAAMMHLPGWRAESSQVLGGMGMLLTWLVSSWLLLSGLALGLLAWRPQEGPRLAMACSLGHGVLLSGVLAFELVLWAATGTLSEVGIRLIGLWWLAVAMLTVGMARLAAGRATDDSDERALRRSLFRQVAELLALSLASGVVAACLLAGFAGRLLSDNLVVAAMWRAEVTEREVQQLADRVRQAQPPRRGEPPAVGQPLADLGLVPVAEPQARQLALNAVPVLQAEDLGIALAPGAGLLLQPGAGGLSAPMLLPAGEVGQPGGSPRPWRFATLPASHLLCREQAPRHLRCATLAGAAGTASAVIELPAPGGDPLWRGSVPGGGAAVAAIVPLGRLGGWFALRIEQSDIAAALALPLSYTTGVLTLLSLALGLWTHRRRIPEVQRLQLEAQRARTVLAHMPQGALLLSEDGAILQLNPEAARLLGQPEPALLGQPVDTVLPAHWRALAEAAGAAEFHLELGGGEGRPLAGHLVPLGAAPRRPSVLLLRDRRAELEAASHLARWQRVFLESGWGMAIASIGERPVFEHVNPAYAAMLGRRTQDLVGQPVDLHIAGTHLERLAELRRIAALEGHVRGEMRHRHADGHEMSTLIDLSVVRDERGRPAYVVASIQDISAIKAMEQSHARTARQLQAVLDALPMGLWIADGTGRVLQTNPAAARLWNAPPDAAANGHDSLLRLASVTRQAVGSQLRAVDDPVQGRRWLSSIATPYFASDGRLLGSIVVDEDQTALRRGEATAREAADLLDQVIQASVCGLAVCDADGRLLQTNVAWHALLGPRAGHDGALGALLEPAQLPGGLGMLGDICREQRPAYQGEHLMHRASGAAAWTLLVVSRLPQVDGLPPRALVQLLDVDGRHRAVDELSANQARLSAAHWIAGLGDWHWHVGADRVELSEQARRLFSFAVGAPAGSATGGLDALLQWIHPEDRARIGAALRATAAQGARFGLDGRLDMPAPAVEVHLQGVVRRDADGVSLAGTVQDVSERKRIERELRDSHERLRELVAHEEMVVEQERKRIAREVHDELGQLVTALRMDLALLQPSINDGASRGHADRMRATMQRMSEVVRHVASHLRPAALDLGLVPAIEWLAEDFSLRWELACHCSLPTGDDLALPEPVALALFRVTQESLTNIARHARASQVEIVLAHEPGGLMLRIRDDGQGFDNAQAPKRGGGLGLLGMRERMLAIGASLNIDSGPQGTEVTILYRPTT